MALPPRQTRAVRHPGRIRELAARRQIVAGQAGNRPTGEPGPLDGSGPRALAGRQCPPPAPAAPAGEVSAGARPFYFYCSDCIGIPVYPDQDATRFYVRVDGLVLCVSCWRARGRPWPTTPAPPPSHEWEEAIRRRMLARGGADAHMVRSGRT